MARLSPEEILNQSIEYEVGMRDLMTIQHFMPWCFVLIHRVQSE
jgi:hypothetical protein